MNSGWMIPKIFARYFFRHGHNSLFYRLLHHFSFQHQGFLLEGLIQFNHTAQENCNFYNFLDIFCRLLALGSYSLIGKIDKRFLSCI